MTIHDNSGEKNRLLLFRQKNGDVQVTIIHEGETYRDTCALGVRVGKATRGRCVPRKVFRLLSRLAREFERHERHQRGSSAPPEPQTLDSVPLTDDILRKNGFINNKDRKDGEHTWVRTDKESGETEIVLYRASNVYIMPTEGATIALSTAEDLKNLFALFGINADIKT